MKKVCSSDMTQSTHKGIPTIEIVELLKSRYILYEDTQKGYTDSTFRCTKDPIKQSDNYYAWIRRSHHNVELKRVASAIIEVDYLIAQIEESF